VNNPTDSGLSRRDLLKTSGQVAVASALAGIVIPHVHAAQNNTIQVALVGCGGRGTGAVENALSVKGSPTKLVAMADVFSDKLARSYKSLKGGFEKQVDVPDKHKFIGFDGYEKAMDCLKAGDVVILTTPPAFRWVHFTYAIKKGLHVFMEKPIAVDGPSARRMVTLGEDAQKKNLKVGVGLMCRHCAARHELFDRIKSGQLGDLLLLRAYRQAGHTAKETSPPNPGKTSDLLYQIRRFHSFLWASGGCYSDFLIHNIDECCWMKDAWPVQAKAAGGRHYRGQSIDQNFDVYSVEYTFGDGTKLLLEGRTIDGCHSEFASYAHGTKGAAVISESGHTPAHCRIFKGQNITKNKKDKNIVWKFPGREPNPYQLEWDHLIDAIRKDKPYNEVKRGAEASLVTAMGRKAAHTGQLIKLEDMRKDPEEFAPQVDKLKMDSLPPVRPDSQGKYPVPKPGILKNREY
jgi:predicted dehydrogenase